MAIMASLAMAPTTALHRDVGTVKSEMQLQRSSEFQYKVARPMRERGNMSMSRVQQVVHKSAASVVLHSMESAFFLCPFWSHN